MKTLEEIREEIEFQEKEYDRIAKKINDPEIPELKRQLLAEVASRHAARRQSLLWVIGA